MRYRLGAGILLFAFLGAPSAMADLADLTNYKIDFAGTGILPTAGSFTYDPDTSTFTAFEVVWDGFSIDFTAAANTLFVLPVVPACLIGKSGGAASFALLTGGCDAPGNTQGWFAQSEFDRSAEVGFFASAAEPTSLEAATSTGPSSHDNSSGTFTTEVVTPAPPAVPEPASVILLSTIFALAGIRRLRGKKEKASSSC